LPSQGFALVVTLSLMVLLTVVAVGMLGLSAITIRSSSQGAAQAQAQANARLALMIAIGELQKEMGPDTRVSAESALFDTNETTEKIDGVGQSHWLASYNSWGGWLNGSYTPPESTGSLRIADTYTPQREKMFRRWLLSVPEGMEKDVNAPNLTSSWNNTNSVVLVGPGTLGTSAATDLTTRAYLTKLNTTGKYAWWIGPENHKARIDMARQPRTLAAAAWQTSQGDTAEVGVGALEGFTALNNNAALGDKLITTQTLRLAPVAEARMKEHFFDLTASSRGVLASVRTGHLKKDLSLLFEKGKSTLPAPYRFTPGDVREPSIRPMSSELRAKNPKLPERHFASWTRMRHFYRMYRQDSDAEARPFPGGVDGVPSLRWEGSKPYSSCNVSTVSSAWDGQDTYVHFPILSHLTYILSQKTELLTTGANKGKYDLRYVASPVCVYWNPYNVELRVPDKKLAMRSYLAQVHTMDGLLSLGGTYNKTDALRFDDDYARMMSGTGQDIIFKPGEFRIFSPVGSSLVGGDKLDMMPGFDPQSFGGLYAPVGAYTPAQNPKYQMRFSNRINSWKFNFREGNTPASFVLQQYWSPIGDNNGGNYTIMGYNLHVDWFNTSQLYTPISAATPWVFDGQILPVGYFQFALKGLHDHSYDTINWERDWRCRNWIQAPPFYLGQGLYMSEDPTIGNTQRMDAAYEMRFGSLLGSGKDVEDIIQHVGQSAMMGKEERVTAVPSLELPTAPIGSLAGFGAMRIHPGWVDFAALNPDWKRTAAPAPANDSSGNSLYRAESKVWAYQSGVTGPGIGNSFLHPMIPRTDVYRFLNNSVSMEMKDILNTGAGYTPTDTKAYCDYWDHVLLLNDALWDDYFVSSLADQTRPGASVSASLDENLKKLANGQELANARYSPYLSVGTADEVKSELETTDGYLKAAKYLMVDGMFNVNSTSVDAWHALFAGIRERQVVHRDKNGALKPVAIPSGKRIALSRFNTANTDQEGNDPEFGIARDDGMQAWSGVRFLDDDQLRKLAEECVKQVKQRGPFLNFSEFINRRLSNDDLGTVGALQAAIDYDDANPESGSINYNFKSTRDFMLQKEDLGDNAYSTPEAAVGSRFAGIPGYVIQSDLLNPIANTLSVRDDTFRIRAYGESIDKSGKVLARAWCEAVVQRVPEYSDGSNRPEVPARKMNPDGEFSDINNSELTSANQRFGRKFQIEGFRWLNGSEI
jgi:hypothetical protein